MMKKIFTEKAPVPAGHYSQAIIHNGLIYVSGQLPIDPQNPKQPIPGIREQAHQMLSNVEQILLAGNSDLSLVIKATVYISDISLWGSVNEVFAEFFKDHKPARVIVPSRELHYGYQTEMEVVAALKS